MDLLSEAVDALRLTRAEYRIQNLKALGAPLSTASCGIHLIEHGRATLRASATRIDVAPGDLVLMPRPTRRTLAARPEARVLSAVFDFSSPEHPLLAALPEVMHVSRERLTCNPQWDAHVDGLRRELGAERAGSRALVARLTEILIIYAMRVSPPPAQAECPSSGWLRGLHDELLQPVLEAMHRAPDRRWSLAQLAKLAGQSRSAFAAHFAAAMGEPPMTYLARWRMFRARSLLRESERSIADIARQIGYGSAAAFSLAFSREHGASPGAFRAQARSARAPTLVVYRSPSPASATKSWGLSRGRHSFEDHGLRSSPGCSAARQRRRGPSRPE